MNKNNFKYIFIASFGFFLVSLFTQLYFSNKLAVKGNTMKDLEVQKEQLSREISELELEMTQYSSMSYIEERAHELGFTENTSHISSIRPATTTAVVPSL